MKTYLITGAAGFIGSNFLKYVLKKFENIRVIVVDILTYAGNLETIKNELGDKRVKFEKVDIRDTKEIERIFLENEIDYVVNFAAESHVDRAIENSKIFLETNILGVHNLLEGAKKSWTVGQDDKGYPIYRKNVKFIQISTDEVYGTLERDFDNPLEIVEVWNLEKDIKTMLKNRKTLKTYGNSFFSEESPLNPRSPYSASKAGADCLIMSYGQTYKMPINIARCSNNYGYAQFPEKLIPLVIKKIINGEKITVYGNGKNVRDWLFVEDCCKGIDLILTDGQCGKIYNMGGYNERENIDVVKKIIDIFKEEIKKNKKYEKILKIEKVNYDLIIFTKDRLGHDERYALNSSKIMKELGWLPETDFEKSLRKTVEWYLENQNWLKSE